MPPNDFSQIVLLILKLTPLGFAVLLRFFGLDYFDEWKELWNSYATENSLTENETAPEWRYHNFSTYLYEKSSTEITLQLSFIYMIALHGLLLFQLGARFLILPMIGYVVIGFLTGHAIKSFYRIDQDGRNPDRYEKFYNRESEIGDRDEQAYRFPCLPLWIDRNLSPPKATILADLMMIANIIALECTLVIWKEKIAELSPVTAEVIATSSSVLTLVAVIGLWGIVSYSTDE